jgi:Domain of unknown function (DUF4263)
MTDKHRLEDGKELLRQLADITCSLPDEQISSLRGDEAFEGFFSAILNPTTVFEYSSIPEFFAANKNRSAIIAGIRAGITRAYAIQHSNGGYASPTEMQWFDNAVMFLTGNGPFEGFLCKYENDQTTYAVAARNTEAGEKLVPNDFVFVALDEVKKQFKTDAPPTAHELEVPIHELQSLLDTNNSDEATYQELLSKHAWIFGLQYARINRHEQLDDKNIPDFTGIRVRDNCCDIFEIKPPSMQVFRSDGEFTASFNAAWNQAERYLHFARTESDYLRRKGFQFDNPKCILICGYNLPSDQIVKLRVKEQMNPSLQVLTFNDLIAFMNSTVDFIKRVSAK